MRRIWSWLDNSIVALLITFPFSLGVVLADNISPWFLMLSALSALLWIPYVTGVAHLIHRTALLQQQPRELTVIHATPQYD